MEIDLFTFLAQIVNFFVLVWLLKKFLYRPILDAVDAREAKIAAQMQAAADAERDATRERGELHAQRAAFEAARAGMLREAQEAAAAERERLTACARGAVDDLRTQWAASLRGDQDAMLAEVAGRVREEVFLSAQKVLTDLADASVHERMTAVFAARLRNADAATKERLFPRGMPATATVRTAADLPSAQREELETAVSRLAGTPVRCAYLVDAALVGGVELTANGQKLAWSIAAYLDAMKGDDAGGETAHAR